MQRGRGGHSRGSFSTSFRSEPDRVTESFSQTSIEDSQERTRLGLRELHEGKFDTTSSSSSASFATPDAKFGIDINWLHEHSFKLYLSLSMEPLELQASSRDVLFRKDFAETQTQLAIEEAMFADPILTKCFVVTRKGDKFLQLPVQVWFSSEHERDITAIFCPPQLKDAPTPDETRAAILKLSVKIPVTFSQSYTPRQPGPHFFVVNFHESNPLDDEITMSLEFHIRYNEEQVSKDSRTAWRIICNWFKETHEYDLHDIKLFSTKTSHRQDKVGTFTRRI
jgi:hypothetical protein